MLPKILVTSATLTYGLVVPILEINTTYVFNPDWPAHARLHEVWQLATISAFAVLALWFVWVRDRKIDGAALVFPISELCNATVHVGCEILARTSGPFRAGFLYDGLSPGHPARRAALATAVEQLRAPRTAGSWPPWPAPLGGPPAPGGRRNRPTRPAVAPGNPTNRGTGDSGMHVRSFRLP